MRQQGDSAGTDDWKLLYDPTDPVQRALARIVGFDPEAPTRDALHDFMEARLFIIDAMASIGPEDIEQLHARVPDAQAKWQAIDRHLHAGRSWPSVERVLGIPWVEQVKLIANGRPTPLWGWRLEQRIDFEEMCRAGASVRSLARTFRLPHHQAAALVNWFCG